MLVRRFGSPQARSRPCNVGLGVGGSVLLSHQLRRYSADVSCARSLVAAGFVALFSFSSSSVVHAEYFVPTGLGGSLSYGYGYSRIANSESEQSNVTLSLNGGGYFWQPWFLTMGAGVGLGLGRSGSSVSSEATSKSLSGSMDLSLFPESRFPTSFGFAQSDSRQDVNSALLNGQSSQTRRFYLRQTYNTLDGTNINAWFDHNTGSASYQTGDSVDRSLGFQIRKRVPYHDFGLGGGYFENDPAQTDIVSTSSNLLLSHSYFPSGEVGVNSLASYSGAASTGGGTSTFRTAYEQVSSSFYWRPEHRPYNISGGALIYTVLSGAASRGVSTNASASYQFAHNFIVNGGMGVSVSDAGGNQSVSSTQSLSTSLPSDQYRIFGFDYGWNVGVGVSNSLLRSETTPSEGSGAAVTETKSQRSISVSASHQLGRSISLGRNAGMNVSFGQNASGSKSSDSDYIGRSFSSSMSLGWNHSGFGGSTTAGTSLSDSRNFGRQASAFQVLSAQLARNQELSRLSSLSGSVSFQASRAHTPDSAVNDNTNNSPINDSGKTSKSASATFGYVHSRFLGVHGLLFNSRLSVPTLLKDERTQSTTSKDWDNTLSYRIGLLALNLAARVTDAGPGQRAYSMTFQAVRSF